MRYTCTAVTLTRFCLFWCFRISWYQNFAGRSERERKCVTRTLSLIYISFDVFDDDIVINLSCLNFSKIITLCWKNFLVSNLIASFCLFKFQPICRHRRCRSRSRSRSRWHTTEFVIHFIIFDFSLSGIQNESNKYFLLPMDPNAMRQNTKIKRRTAERVWGRERDWTI